MIQTNNYQGFLIILSNQLRKNCGVTDQHQRQVE